MSRSVGDSILLAYRRIQNGLPVTGLAITVSVRDAVSGAVLLTSQPLVEVTPGLYRYVWSGSATPVSCMATYVDNGRNYDEFFDISYGTWDTPRSVHTASGSFGESNQSILSDGLADLGATLLDQLAHTQQQIKVTVGSDLQNNMLIYQTSLSLDGIPVTSPASASIAVFDSTGLQVFSAGPISTPTAQGIFTFTQNNATASMASNQSYMAYSTVTVGAKTYTSLSAFTVF